MKIAVVSIENIKISIIILSQNFWVLLVDIVSEKVRKINTRISLIQDKYI